MLFTGKLVNGAEAAAIGLAHEAVEPGEALATALRRARAAAACAPEAMRLMKRSLYGGAGWDPRSAARAEAFAQAATMRTEDAREGIWALLEKREPRFAGKSLARAGYAKMRAHSGGRGPFRITAGSSYSSSQRRRSRCSPWPSPSSWRSERASR